MHPILARARHLALYLLAAIAVGALVSASLASSAGQLWTTMAVFVPASAAYAAACLSTWYLCRAFPLSTGAPLGRLLFVHGLAAVLASSLWGGLVTAWAGAIDWLSTDLRATAVVDGRGPAIFLVGTFVYGLAAVVHYLFIAVDVSRGAERRALEQHVLAKEAELKALRAQIDPHFMFNSLHSISALTTTDPAAAREMALLLADFLRETLRLGALRRISLADELAIVDRFVAIERIRFGSRLVFERSSSPDLDTCLVPPLIIQPLVENAVVHGVSQLVEGGVVTLRVSRDKDVLTIDIENPCDPDRARTRGVGLGLDLLGRRLSTHYGIANAVRATERDGRFRVEVSLPVEYAS